MEIEEMTLKELKKEWVLVINDFDSYQDKQEFRAKINRIEDRITELETT